MSVNYLYLSILFFLAGCASGPRFDTALVDRSLTPANVQSQYDASQGKTVLWGGVILDFSNFRETSQIEVLAYPLNSAERPQLDKNPLGRFILLHEGFLEPTVYLQGKLLSASGTIAPSQQGRIGESEYVYPVLNAQKIKLWAPERDVRSSFHIGIGIGF
jgi:outer membrane lipoprotein